MYQSVVSVRPNEDFSLAVAFEDGTEGVLDMKPYLDFGVFKRLQDLARLYRLRDLSGSRVQARGGAKAQNSL